MTDTDTPVTTPSVSTPTTRDHGHDRNRSSDADDDLAAQHEPVAAVVEDLPWEVGLSRNPQSGAGVIQFASEAVGTVTHYVCVSPATPSTSTPTGYRVEKSYAGATEPILVEEGLGSLAAALEVARETITRLHG